MYDPLTEGRLQSDSRINYDLDLYDPDSSTFSIQIAGLSNLALAPGRKSFKYKLKGESYVGPFPSDSFSYISPAQNFASPNNLDNLNFLSVTPSTPVAGGRQYIEVHGAELARAGQDVDLAGIRFIHSATGDVLSLAENVNPEDPSPYIILHSAKGAHANPTTPPRSTAGGLIQRLKLDVTIGDQVPAGLYSLQLTTPGGMVDYVIEDCLHIIRMTPMVISTQTGEVQPMGDIPVSDPSPIIKLDYADLTLASEAEPGDIYGDLHISGTVTSGVCDITPGADGRIDNIELYINGSDEPFTTITLNVTKEDSGPLHKPYAYTGTFNTTISVTDLQFGNNSFILLAEDNVYGREGISEFAVRLDTKAPSDPDPGDPSSGGLGYFNQPYTIELDLAAVNALADLDNGAEIPATVTSVVCSTCPQIVENLVKVGDNPLTLDGDFVTVTITDEDTFEDAIEGTSTTWTANVSVPTYSFMPRNMTLRKVGATGKLFKSDFYQVELTFNSADPFTLNTRLRLNDEAWIEETLTSQAATPLLYKNGDSSFVIDAAGVTFDPAKQDGISVRVTNTAFGLTAYPIDAMEFGLDALVFKTTNFDISFVPFPTEEDEEPIELPLLTGPTFALYESQPSDNEFYPMAIRVEGDPAIIAHESFKVTTRAGDPKVVEYLDGYFYVAREDTDEVAIALAIRSTEVAGPSQLPDFDPEQSPAVGSRGIIDSGKFLGGFMVGFCEGGIDLVVGVLKLGWWAVNAAARHETDKLYRAYLYWADHETYLAVVAREKRQRDATIASVKNFALGIWKLAYANTQESFQFWMALYNKDYKTLAPLSMQYIRMLILCEELISYLKEEIAYLGAYEQGRMFGKIMFEVAGLLIPFTKAGKLSKLNIFGLAFRTF